MPQYVIVLLIVLLACVVLWGIYHYLHKQIEQMRSELADQQHSIEQIVTKLRSVADELHEIRSGDQALGRKVKELITTVNQLDSKQQQFAEHDPHSRYYQKGAKLIAAGATLEEVMRECELPRAEAELLFSLHQR